jgi:hypothetical protein
MERELGRTGFPVCRSWVSFGSAGCFKRRATRLLHRASSFSIVLGRWERHSRASFVQVVSGSLMSLRGKDPVQRCRASMATVGALVGATSTTSISITERGGVAGRSAYQPTRVPEEQYLGGVESPRASPGDTRPARRRTSAPDLATAPRRQRFGELRVPSA